MTRPIYLDYNGTTPHDPEVIEAMRPFLETEFGNPSSSHWYGIKPKKAVEAARDQVAGILNCSPSDSDFHQRRHRIQQPCHPGHGPGPAGTRATTSSPAVSNTRLCLKCAVTWRATGLR